MLKKFANRTTTTEATINPRGQQKTIEEGKKIKNGRIEAEGKKIYLLLTRRWASREREGGEGRSHEGEREGEGEGGRSHGGGEGVRRS